MDEEKAPANVNRRMAALKGETPLRAATFEIRAGPGGAGDASSVTVARGSCSGSTFGDAVGGEGELRVVLSEGTLLGGGASGTVRRVDLVDDRLGGGAITSFALKRMRKTFVMSTPEHIFCERNVTREVTHWACMRQHASFKDETYLYFLLDFVDGCDLMDALAAVAAVKSVRDPAKTFAPKVKMLRGMPEDAARYYVATIALALEYLHDRDVVYRDMKPENVLLARDGSAKLGDFGFAKRLNKGAHTYTFCGTPGYVAPEVVLARGYGTSVDWWGLGVLMYVLLTGQQPFSQMVNGQPEDPLTVMKRIVDRSWSVSFPVYVSDSAVDVIRKFLERRSVKRLGNLRRRAEDVFDHPWFTDARFDWKGLRDGTLKPKPLALSENFEKQRARRIAQLERSLKGAAADARVSEEEAAAADAVFADF
jgi:cGMP-dependent protein kinase 2